MREMRSHATRNPVHPLRKTWRKMIDRCEKPGDPAFADYGGRGIVVCLRWKTFTNFAFDMGPKPTRRHSLDRIKNDGNYEPENCRWATAIQQQRNKRTSRILHHNGQSRCLAEWAEILGMSADAIRGRLKRGRSVAEALVA